MSSINIARRGQLFGKTESSFGDAAVTFAATDAIRHVEFALMFDPKARELSKEKKSSPGGVTFLDRRVQASWDLKAALLRPSGTLNTVPEASDIFEAAFGSKTNVTLSTAIGIPALSAALAGDGAGNVDDGAHEYYYTYVDATGESKVSALATVTVADKTADGKVDLSGITAGPSGTTSRKIYRTEAGQTGVANAKLLTTLNDNTTLVYEDNTADSGLGAAAPSTDASAVMTTKRATLLDVTGLAKGDGLAITRAGTIYVRRIASISGTHVTWDNALPTTAAFADVVKGCLSYKLTTDLAASLAFFHVVPGGTAYRRMMVGCGVDKFAIRFNANEEPQFSASGPAKRQYTSSLPSTPASFTTVGGNPPSCLVGDLMIGDTAYLHKDADVTITNGLKARNAEAGNDGYASEVYRAGRRVVELSLGAYVETEATLYDLAEAGTTVAVLKQVGRTEGNIVAIAMPVCDFKVPETSDGDEEAEWSFKAVCRESADGENDEITLFLA